MTENTDSSVYVSMLIMCNIMLGYNDRLEGTPYFQRGLKKCSRELGKELERLTNKELNKLIDCGENQFRVIEAHQEEIIKFLTSLSTPQWEEINNLLKTYEREMTADIEFVHYWESRALAAEQVLRENTLKVTTSYEKWQNIVKQENSLSS